MYVKCIVMFVAIMGKVATGAAPLYKEVWLHNPVELANGTMAVTTGKSMAYILVAPAWHECETGWYYKHMFISTHGLQSSISCVSTTERNQLYAFSSCLKHSLKESRALTTEEIKALLPVRLDAFFVGIVDEANADKNLVQSALACADLAYETGAMVFMARGIPKTSIDFTDDTMEKVLRVIARMYKHGKAITTHEKEWLDRYAYTPEWELQFIDLGAEHRE